MRDDWKFIDGYSGHFKINKNGHIRSVDRVIELKNGGFRKLRSRSISTRKNSDGYTIVNLSLNGAVKVYRLHRLLATAFIPNPKNLPIINHKNGKRSDNRLINLEWSTQKENVLHGFMVLGRKGSSAGKFGRLHHRSKPVAQINSDGEIIMRYECARETEKYGFHQGHVSACCRGVNKTHAGYKWEYVTVEELNR